MEAKIEKLVDEFTNRVLEVKYGDRYKNINNIEDYPEINDDWEYINNQTFELAIKIFQ